MKIRTRVTDGEFDSTTYPYIQERIDLFRAFAGHFSDGGYLAVRHRDRDPP